MSDKKSTGCLGCLGWVVLIFCIIVAAVIILPSFYIQEESSASQKQIPKKRIVRGAISDYTDEFHFPRLNSLYTKEQLRILTIGAKAAAQKVLLTSTCDEVHFSHYSEDKSTKDKAIFIVDCQRASGGDTQRYYCSIGVDPIMSCMFNRKLPRMH